ncbi:MAG: hypothetical protein Tsb0020_09330 [Haliangiales bacterium]
MHISQAQKRARERITGYITRPAAYRRAASPASPYRGEAHAEPCVTQDPSAPLAASPLDTLADGRLEAEDRLAEAGQQVIECD